MLGILSFLAWSCGKENPVKPEDTDTFAISGIVLDAELQGLKHVSIHIRGNGEEWDISTGASGRFSLSGLEKGEYVLSAAQKNYIIKPESLSISLLPGESNTASFFGIRSDYYLAMQAGKVSAVFGRIMTTENRPVPDVRVDAGVMTTPVPFPMSGSMRG
jgi:hypothetical protein